MDPLDPAARGKRTLLEAFDQWVHAHPGRVVAAIPTSSDVAEGFRDVTYGELGRAVDGLAHMVVGKYGRSETFETIMFMGGASDLAYAVCFYAFQKCGYKTMLLAPGNQLEHNIELLRATSCNKCMCSQAYEPVVEKLQGRLPELRADVMENWDCHVQPHQEPFQGLHRTHEQSRWDPVLVLHSSGSTGAPRPVILRNGYFTANDARFPPMAGREMAGMDCYRRLGGDRRIYSPIPAHHLSGFGNICVYPVFAGCINVQTPAGVARAGPGLVKDIIDHQGVRLMCTVPSDTEGIVRLPGGARTLSRLDYLAHVGGPLSRALGDALTRRVRLVQFYGSTECGGTGLLVPRAEEDWEYLEYHPDFAPRFERVGGGGGDGGGEGKAWELVWTNPGGAVADCVMCKWTLPPHVQGVPTGAEVEEAERRVFPTKDLFVPHPDPTRRGLWRFIGRRDDMLVVANGDLLNPVPAELAVARHPRLTGALVVGQGRLQLALLVEPVEAVGDPAQLVDEIWPEVERANEVCSEGWGSLSIRRKMIAVVGPGSFVRPPKATIARKETVDKFSNVIDSLYCS